MKNAFGIATLLIFSFPAVAMPQETRTPQESGNEFARKILLNEAKAEDQDHSHWILRSESEKSQGKEVDEVVETKYGDLQRHLVIGGRPLNPQQQHDEDLRIQRVVHNPAVLRRSMKSEKEDSDRSQKMLRMLPDALIFTYGERHGDIVELHFTSNAKFRPPSHEAQVFQALEGNMWVDSKQCRLVELTGHLKREVKFGGGWLGYLNPGGQFQVKQTEVAPGYWELTLLDVNMTGKALLFKSISVQQKMKRTGFRKVPDDLPLSQAADLLRKDSTVAESSDVKASR